MPPIATRFVEFQQRRTALTSRPKARQPSDAERGPSSPASEEQRECRCPRLAPVVPLTPARRELSVKRQSVTSSL
jgi:hypothetical protein